MIDYATIERIQSVAQIYDVVSDFINLRKRGVNYVGLCPFHEDSNPSFYVSPSKNICKCFSCGEGGTPIHFIMKHESLSYPEALRYLAKKYSIEIQETELTDEQKQAQTDRESMFIINGFAQKTFARFLFDTEEGQTIGLSYFKERGFREDTIRKFGLGYSPDEWDALVKEAEKNGYNTTFLEKTGLAIARDNGTLYDRFRGRVMFPVYSLSGKVVAFGGRTLKKDEKAKYVNSPESEIYHKSNELYGLYPARQAIAKKDKCFLVEGYTDVISMHQAGIENVVSSSGTALTEGQIRLIYRFTKNVTVLYDGDEAGIKAALRGIDLLLEYGLNIKIVLLPEGEDPDSFARKQNAESFINYIDENETDFIHFKVNLLAKEAENDPAKKVKMITEIVDTIALIPEEIVRLVYIKECSKILDIQESALARNVAKKRQEVLTKKKKTLYPDQEEPERYDYPQPEEDREGNGDTVVIPTDLLLNKHELSILYYVVRFGETEFYSIEDEATGAEQGVKVIEHIYNELKKDELLFGNPLYRRILEEAYERRNDEGIVMESFFINHPDPEVSKLAVDLSTNKYIESKIHFKHREQEDEKEKLIDAVPYVLLNYMDVILKSEMDELNKKIKKAEENNDLEQLTVLINQLSELWQKSKKTIALHLRERIITKI